ncbi:hypothetical protein PybrP1_003425 [[Pythium] brassicae (nom. inval.)]|nr:hypothetical protein PybrP1_003425 [[Pythium] brassicae (nom. inval.)]
MATSALPAAPCDDWFAVKLQRAGEWRARGNDAFKAEKLAKAVRAYKQAIRWLACPAECVYDREEAAEVAPIALACHSNLATSFWKLGKWDTCIAQASLALAHDPASVKALFRRSQALVETKAFDDAVRDLESAHELEPDSKLVRAALERARAARSRHTAKQREAFAQLF